MRVLGIDTSTQRASVALTLDEACVVERSHGATGSHAVSLLPLIDQVLEEAQCPIAAVEAIAVAAGPGSFTGLRIALSVAKGLARVTGAHLVTVPTLEALAWTVAAQPGIICPVLDARKGEVYAAAFESLAGGWRQLISARVVTPEQLTALLPPEAIVLGDALVSYASWMQCRRPDLRLLPFEGYGPRGSAVAALGRARLQRGQSDSVAEAEPVYVRPCDAERGLP